MPTAPTPSPRRVRRLLRPGAVAVVFGWALYQSFWNLAAADPSADEPVYVEAGWAYVHGDFAANREHPPTAKLLFGLAQLLLGPGELSGRILTGVLAVLGGIVLLRWLRAEIGWAGALFAAGAWMLLPHGVDSGPRLDRFAVLDPVMAFFALAAFAAGWRSFRTRSWAWLALAAVLMALSVTSKLSAATMVPAVLLLPLVGRRLRDAALGAALFTAVFSVVFVGVYLPMGIRSALGYLAAMQSEHNATGHLVVVAGAATTSPPWWTNLLFMVEGMGVVATAVLVVGAAAAFCRRPRTLALYLVAGIVPMLVFHLLVSRVMLPHYYVSWAWPLCALAGIGVSALLTRGRRMRAGTLHAGTLLAAALVIAAVVAAAGVSVAIAETRSRGMALVPAELETRRVAPGPVLVAGMAPWEYTRYLGGRQTIDPGSPGIVAAVTKESLRFPIDPAVEALLASRAAAGRLEAIVIDDVTLSILRRAGKALLPEQPPGSGG